MRVALKTHTPMYKDRLASGLLRYYRSCDIINVLFKKYKKEESMREYILRLKVKTILVTALITSLLWLIPVVKLYDTLVNLKEDIDQSHEEYVMMCEEQIEVLEVSLLGKNHRIETLEEQIESIQKSYEQKLEKSELVKYHLESSVLSEEQLKVADKIAHIVASNYEEYGVLPSVAVGQAMQESSLGEICPSNNLWGISSDGYASFSSLEEGVIEYLKCINNGYYDGALFERDYLKAMQCIQDGGYCQPKEGYASEVIKCIEEYEFIRYDNYYLE